jgi:hypothetical protein
MYPRWTAVVDRRGEPPWWTAVVDHAPYFDGFSWYRMAHPALSPICA